MNKLDLIKKKLKKQVVDGKFLLRKNNTYREDVDKDILIYDIFYDNNSNADAIKRIVQEQGLNYHEKRVYGKQYNYSIEFKIPIKFAGKQPDRSVTPLTELSNDMLVSHFSSLIEMSNRYYNKPKHKNQYEEMKVRLQQIEKEILKRMVDPNKH